MTNINYPIEKKQVINCSQFLNFQSFIKSTEIFINNYTDEDIKNNEKEQEETKENKDESHNEKNNENNSNINDKLSLELKNIYQKIDTLNAKINFSEIAEESEENEKSLPNSAKLDTKKSTPKTPFKEEPIIPNENLQRSEEKEARIKSDEKEKDMKLANHTSIYEIYDRKVKNIMTTLLNYEFPTTMNKGDLYIVKRNYELLLNLFQVAVNFFDKLLYV